MANSKFEYVKGFETQDVLFKDMFIVIRIDGRGFTKFCEKHEFEKPNDLNALKVSNKAAKTVMKEFHDAILAYGESDEYSFVFRRSTNLFNRRKEKILSCVISCFTSAYVFNWSKFFPDKKLLCAPTFDARIVLYPRFKNVKDYFSWRQVDCHINNQYNTVYWCLVLKSGYTKEAAQKRLKGTFTKDKNEIMFTEFGINYNDIDEIFKKGTTLIKLISDKKDPISKPMKKLNLDTKTTKEGDSEKKDPPTQITDTDSNKKDTEEAKVPKEQKDQESAQGTKTEGKTEEAKEDLRSKSKKKKDSIIMVHENMVKEDFWMKYNLKERLK